MNFVSRADVAAPLDYVFAALSDFDGFARLAEGMEWEVRFRIRHSLREMEIRLERFDAPDRMRFAGQSRNLTGDLVLELSAGPHQRTRLEVKPQTLTARLQGRLDSFARETERRFASGALAGV